MDINKYLRLTFLLMLFIVSINQISVAIDPEPNTEGIALSLTALKGNKGIVLPKVKLEKLDSYLPVSGDPLIGMLIENIADKGDIDRGIYRWNGQSWAKLVHKADLSSIDLGTKIYTGLVDPNLSQVDEVINAAQGSIYIQEGKSTIYVKEQSTWRAVIEQKEAINYIGSNSIKITKTENGNEIQVQAGAGIKVSPLGILVSKDDSKLSIDSVGKLTLMSDEALWNASKLNGDRISNNMPSRLGELLIWNVGEWAPQGTDRKVDIQGKLVYLSGISGSYPQSSEDSLLMVDEGGRIKPLSGTVWQTDGNSQIPSGNNVLGFVRIDSKASIDIMTNGQTRMRFLDNGVMQMVTKPNEKTALGPDDRMLMIDNTGTIYRSKKSQDTSFWTSGGNSEIMDGTMILGMTNKASLATIEVNVPLWHQRYWPLRIYQDGQVVAFSMKRDDWRPNDYMTAIDPTGVIYRFNKSFPFWDIQNDESAEIKAKHIKFTNLPFKERNPNDNVLGISKDKSLYRMKSTEYKPVAFASEKSETNKYRDIKAEYLGSMKEISDSYKEFKIPLNLQKNSTGKIELYITSAYNGSGSLSGVKPVTVLLYYDYINNFEPRITDAVIVGGIRGSGVPAEIMDHSSDDITDNVSSNIFKTKGDIERKPFTLGSMYITSTEFGNSKYYLHLPIKGSSGANVFDNRIILSIELESKPIEAPDDF